MDGKGSVRREIGAFVADWDPIPNPCLHSSPIPISASLDNVFIERLWRSLKYECVYLHAFENGLQAKRDIANWMTHYNTERPHSKFDGQTPDEVYQGRNFVPPHSGSALASGEQNSKTAKVLAA